MSWVATRELPQNRDGGVDYKARRDYTREFLVTMSLPTDGSIQVSVAPNVPRIGDLFVDQDGTYDLGARCYSVTAKQDADDLLQWHVTAKYTSGDRSRYSRFQPERGDSRYQDPDPLARPAQIIWGSQKFQRPFEQDFTDPPNGPYPVQNSAGDPFDPPIMVDDTLPTLTVIRNEGSFDPGVPIIFKDAINNDEFFGAPQYCAKVESITARSNVENNFLYWEVTYVFSFKRWNPPTEKGFLLLPRDQGFYAIDPNTNKKSRILDDLGQPVVTPKKLDGFGHKLTDNTQTFYLLFQPYKALNFSDLNLP